MDAQKESAQRMSACVTALLRRQPFFGSLALRLPLRADAGRETLASDGKEILYSPRWVADTDAHLIGTAMARVVLACTLKHHTRRGERGPERWQLASQLVTHGLLRDAGFTLPPDAEAWEGMSVEEAYGRLPEPDEGDAGNPSSGGGTDGVDSGGPDDSPDAGGADEDDGDGQAGKPGDDSGAPRDGQGRNGPGQDSGAGSPPSFDPSGTGEVMDAPAGGGDDSAAAPADISAEEHAWDEAMHQAINLARAEGKLPGGIEETVRGAHASILDWRSLLRRYMTGAAKTDYSWSLPNRRFIDGGLYLPSIRSEGIDAIAVIIDTSGSLPSGTLAGFWAEVREIASEINPERVAVLQVDTEVRDAAEYSVSELPEEIAVKGRGGTDFRPGFAWLEEQGIQPAVCLYFTDMECSSYPEAEPAFPVTFCNWGPVPPDRNREPWGERIDMAED